MANFKLDPADWLPQGHQVIDGGPTRLPRTFYSPSMVPPRQHDHIIAVELMPLAPEALVPFWRNQVCNFIVHNLQCTVDNVQPCLFGLGFYSLHSAAACAALLTHPLYQIQNGVFVCFVRHDDRDNHRTVQGFRQGWLMFLGIPLGCRNDFDIANAIATFGKFHHWHQDDEFLDRTMVYASFRSAALVPRDVVFGNYAIVGGVRQTWTAVCYVLTIDFGDLLPHDED
jgi:hypothetical protein